MLIILLIVNIVTSEISKCLRFRFSHNVGRQTRFRFAPQAVGPQDAALHPSAIQAGVTAIVASVHKTAAVPVRIHRRLTHVSSPPHWAGQQAFVGQISGTGGGTGTGGGAGWS